MSDVTADSGKLQLMAEIELLRKQVVSWCHTKERDQAEIERLRTALREIVEWQDLWEPKQNSLADYAIEIARAALEGK